MATQCQLLAEPALSINKAAEVSLVLAIEFADRNKRLGKLATNGEGSRAQSAVTNPSLNKDMSPLTRTVESYHCERPYPAPDCWFKKAECHLCKKKRKLEISLLLKKIDSLKKTIQSTKLKRILVLKHSNKYVY